MLLAVFGTYSIQNSYSDILLMFSLGVIMYFASKVGFSPVPVVLGIILGPIAENNFLLGNMIGSSQGSSLAYFMTGTINIVLISICVISITYGIYSDYVKKNEK